MNDLTYLHETVPHWGKVVNFKWGFPQRKKQQTVR